MQRVMRRKVLTAFSVLLFSALFIGASSRSNAAELVMFESPGCPWCLMWHREIGPIYPKTPESKIAPLRRIVLSKDMPLDISLSAPVVATPTFVLVESGKEIGRLTGYKDEASFWGLLGVLLQKLPNAERGAGRRML
jgi:hypothetical protein